MLPLQGKGLVPGQGTKILHAAQLSPKIKEWGSFFNSGQCNLFALCIAYFRLQWHEGEGRVILMKPADLGAVDGRC